MCFKDLVQVLRRLCVVSSPSLSSSSPGHPHHLELHISVAAKPDLVKSNTVSDGSDQPSQSPRPRRVALAEPSSEDCRSMQDSNEVDCSPWEIQPAPPGGEPPNHHSPPGTPLRSEWTCKTTEAESSSPRDIAQFDESQLSELIRRSVTLDTQLPRRLLHHCVGLAKHFLLSRDYNALMQLVECFHVIS